MEVSREKLEKIELTLDTRNPETGDIPIKILGFGEISLVFTIIDDPNGNIAYKRLPIFSSKDAVEDHIKSYEEYNRLLGEDIGINIPDYTAEWVYMDNKQKNISLFCCQTTVIPESVCGNMLQHMSEQNIQQLVLLMMKEMQKIWQFNLDNKESNIQVALDGQISNWAIKNFIPGNYEISANTELVYLDTSTPMYRIDGQDAMDAKLFLKSVPPGLRIIVKLFFLNEVLDRYYDWREVTIDLIANLYKEQKSQIIPELIELVNEYFANNAAHFNIKPISLKEVKKYYKSDKFIWVLFQNLRLFHRFIKTKIFRRKYVFYLPPKIKR